MKSLSSLKGEKLSGEKTRSWIRICFLRSRSGSATLVLWMTDRLFPNIGFHRTSTSKMYEIQISFTTLVSSMLFPDTWGEAPVPSSMLFPDSCLKILRGPPLFSTQLHEFWISYIFEIEVLWIPILGMHHCQFCVISYIFFYGLYISVGDL